MPKRTKEEELAYKSLSKEERKALRIERAEKRREIRESKKQ